MDSRSHRSPVAAGTNTASGALVTLEGTDGSGKSTQIGRLAAWLEDREIDYLTTFEPGGTRLGESIRRCFLDAPDPPDGKLEALLMFADRRHHLEQVIRPAIAAGQIVLCDRFTDSTIAYQGFGRGVPLKDLAALDRWATGGMTPDLTLLFDVSSSTAADRARRRSADHDRLDGEHAEFYERVRRGYRQLARSDPGRFRIIDASKGVDETSEAAIVELERWLGGRVDGTASGAST